MISKPKLSESERQSRKQVYEKIRDAFAEKYDFLGGQAAREMLMSAASWNVNRYSDPPMRFRNHVMLTWSPGWLKSSMLRKMKKVLGDDLVSDSGKFTSAVLRGSLDSGSYSPPLVLKSPIVISTEFGQTDFSDDELLSSFLALLEEGETNVSLNKLAGMSEGQKSNVEERFKRPDGDKAINFGENEFSLKTDFVFWGATHDPTQLSENALKSRFNVVTPAQPLTGNVTEAVDKAPPIEKILDKTDLKDVRRMLRSQEEVATNFKPPSEFYQEFSLSPRESRDIQSYMAARNWWGLEVNPKIMKDYARQLKESRRIADMTPAERVKNLIFDSPMTYDEIKEKTGYSKIEIHNIFEQIDAKRAGTDANQTAWVVRSGERGGDEEESSLKDDFLSDVE